MIRQLLLSCLVALSAATQGYAHHTIAAAPHTMATVRIPEGLIADGKPLPGGIYEVIITDEHPAHEAGTPSENQRWVEFVQDRKVVAREIAEVLPGAERPVGTSGSESAGRARAVVQTLRGGEFVRIALNAGGERFLIHLAPSQAPPQN